MKIEKWLREYTQELCGKRIAVTGSTGGLGHELCSYLAHLGASLVLLDRNAKRSEAHRASLLARFPEIEVTCVPLDLEDLASADRALERLREMPIDVLIHNAGAYSIPRHKCASGYDNVFQINFATPYYLIRKLLPDLRAHGGRVVAVGSIAHRASHIDETDVDFSRRRAASKVYGNAKRYLMYGLFELFADETNVSLAIAHPGITPTNITSHYPRVISALIKYPMRWIFMSPKRAALSVLRGVFEETEYATWIGPAFFDIWGCPKKKKLYGCNEAERRRIAVLSSEIFKACTDTALWAKEEEVL